ncbi:MAG: hypothetical protein IJ071_02290 [Ruminococcus sp.]|nr:hypothetical protein [Ruminococcus sp.]
MQRGVFWLIRGSLRCFPFDGTVLEGAARSGNTFNHKRLWEHLRPCGESVGFGYYPRGRVEITPKGRAVVYMSPHIGTEHLPEIMAAFGLAEEPAVKYDHSEHYRCYLDE